MQGEAGLVGLANAAGAQVLWWYLAGLVGMLALGIYAALRRQHRLPGLGLGLALIAAAVLIFAMLAGNLVAEASVARFDRLLSAAIQVRTSSAVG